MSLIETLTIAVALGTDAFSVALVCGTRQYELKTVVKISLVIALFHIFMPLLGFYGADLLEKLMLNYTNFAANIDRILSLVGAGLLALIGFYMLLEKWLVKEGASCYLYLQGFSLLVMAFSVSLDSLSVGISLGMLGAFSLGVVLLIGIIAGLMMASGLFLGCRVGYWLGEEAQLLGGLALIVLGIHFAGFI